MTFTEEDRITRHRLIVDEYKRLTKQYKREKKSHHYKCREIAEAMRGS